MGDRSEDRGGLGVQSSRVGKGEVGTEGWVWPGWGRRQGLLPAESSPEVLDVNHLAPGPGPVHGPPIRIRALARRGLCERSAHTIPQITARGSPGSSLA